MQSKTSCFNKTVFKKNLTRFAPVWVLYALCLVLGLVLMYSNGGRRTDFYFAYHMGQMPSVMGVVNLGYALLAAQLLFGDLYTSRMCNALHALPLRRESWFVTNMVSGLVFSLVPTFLMSLVALPLLMGSLFENAWSLSLWLFLSSNLQFLCYFGIAAFAAMCVGNRFTMVAGYGLLNFGAYVVYWLVDTVYTPMLYGVITPTALVENLTPFAHYANRSYFKMDTYSRMVDLFGEDMAGASAVFTLTDEWWRLWVLAGVGIVFAVLALVLYRKRDLECAGDAVAFRVLVPVFQVLCAIFVATAAQFFLYTMMGLRTQNLLVLSVGLVVGWFVGKMLLERSTRVISLRNCRGLALLAAVFAVSLWMTHVDIFGIETRLPDADKVKSVHLSSDWTSELTLEDPEDIKAMLRLQETALEERAEESGTYVLGTNGEWIRYIDSNSDLIDEESEDNQYKHVAQISLDYEMESGKLIRRRYNVWVDSEAGQIAEAYLSRWDYLTTRTVTIDGKEVNRLDFVMDTFENFRVDGFPFESMKDMPAILKNKEKAQELLSALRADAQAGNMAQHPYFHYGYFRYESEYSESGYEEPYEMYVRFQGKDYSWGLSVYADSENTLRWLEENGLMTWEVIHKSARMW